MRRARRVQTLSWWLGVLLAAAQKRDSDVASHFPFNFKPQGNEESHLQEHGHACLFYTPVSSWYH